MLINYEFLKILRRKSTLIMLTVSLLVTGFLFGLPIMQYQTVTQNETIRGLAGITYERERQKELSASLTDEYIHETINEYQQLFRDPENVGYDGNEKFLIGHAYWQFVSPRIKLLDAVAANYDQSGENSGYDKLPEMDLKNTPDFYQLRTNKIQTLLNTPSRELSEQQKEYWSNMSSEVKVPFQYGYYEGWAIIISSFELLMFGLLAVCIILAPVFSGEYSTGIAAILLASKYGKTKLIRAKIIASLLFGVLAFTLHILLAFGLLLAAFGVDGWDLQLQIANTTIPYPLTFLQAVGVNLVVVYVLLLAMIGFTLLLSAKMKSPYLVLTILVPVLFIPLFLSPSGTTGWYNQLLFLLPYRATMPELNKYISYQIGPLVLDVFAMRMWIYGGGVLISLPIANSLFKKHQVSG